MDEQLTVWEKIGRLFADHARKLGTQRDSPHAKGRKGQREKKKTRNRAKNRAASQMRAIQRRRDKGSSKRQRS